MDSPSTLPAVSSSSTAIHATIAICTFNRCDSLAETLAALLVHEATGIAFDILVVDNASTDATRAVVERFQGGPLAVRYVYEGRPGTSFARNTALDHTSAPYIVFVDDDVLPTPGWLCALLRTFDEFAPSPAAVGGTVHLRWTHGQPDWLPDELRGVYSYIDCGPSVQQVRRLHGCNVAFPTELARRYGFDPRLGRIGGTQIPGEDIEILIHMQRDGLPVVYQPGAVVWHIVGAYRENRDYVVRRSAGVGTQEAILAVKYEWPGRLGVVRLVAHDAWNRRHWLKRIARSWLSGKLVRDAQERTWVRHVLARFGAFERTMLTFVLRGRAALGCADEPPATRPARKDL